MRTLPRVAKPFSRLYEQGRARCDHHLIGRKIGKAVAVVHLGGCLLVFSPFARGQDITADYSDAYHKCIDEAGNTNALLGCVAAEKSKWDIRLSNAYRTLMGSRDFSPETKQRLSEAQEMWGVFEDKSCDADAALDIEGGTGFNLAKAGCTLKMTAQRAMELESFLRLPDGAARDRSPEAPEHGSDKSKSSR